MKKLFQSSLIFTSLLIIFSCSTDEELAEESSNSNSNDTSSNSGSTQVTSSVDPINPDFECGNGLYYLSRPEPVSVDNTHQYYEYPWQSSPNDMRECV